MNEFNLYTLHGYLLCYVMYVEVVYTNDPHLIKTSIFTLKITRAAYLSHNNTAGYLLNTIWSTCLYQVEL